MPYLRRSVWRSLVEVVYPFVLRLGVGLAVSEAAGGHKVMARAYTRADRAGRDRGSDDVLGGAVLAAVEATGAPMVPVLCWCCALGRALEVVEACPGTASRVGSGTTSRVGVRSGSWHGFTSGGEVVNRPGFSVG